MKIEILADTDSVAREAAAIIAEQAQATVAERSRFILGVSGGQTPAVMLRYLASKDLPWNQIEIVQVDERIVPATHPERNLIALHESLRRSPLQQKQIHPMPVEATDLSAAAKHYADLLQTIAGSPPVLDMAHLGLGTDGHTASLVPGDPVLDVTDVDVALTAEYRGRRRMTLTYPMLNRSRRILWVVTGSEKEDALARLRDGDQTIPAGRIRRDMALVLADSAAAGQKSIS